MGESVTVDTVIAALADQQAELSGLLRAMDDADWRRPTPCDGWDVADVVLHLAQTNEMAIASIQGRLEFLLERLTTGEAPVTNVDDGAATMVEHERGASDQSVHIRWRDGADELRSLFERSDPHQRVTWVAGQLSIRTLATTRLSETWIHTGDVAIALDRDLPHTDRLRHIARLAWRTLPYAFERDHRVLSGPVAFELRGPHGDEWNFSPDEEARTTIRGDAVDLCMVAARRVEPSETSLVGTGPDADAVLELVRTYA